MMTYHKFNSFVEAVAEKTFELQTDTLTVALTNTLPVATNTILANITEISYTNISSRALTVSTSAQTGGVYKLVISNLVLTASGSVGPFRYVVIYDATATNKDLICWFDLNDDLPSFVPVTMQSGDTITLSFDATNGLMQIT